MINAPWHFPVPLKKSNLTGLTPEDQVYNIGTDLGFLNSPLRYGPQSAENFLCSDAQTPYTTVIGRWGAGRSGFYQGKYLKGIGLTPLAAQWPSSDFLHSSGHLPFTSGVWELLISDVLRKLGLEKTINSTETILVAPVESEYAQTLKKLSAQSPPMDFCPANLHLRAVTVKSGNFIRPSNIIWLLSQTTFDCPETDPLSFPNLLRLLWQGCEGQFQSLPEEVDLESIVQKLQQSLVTTLENLKAYFNIGLDWCNYQNNMTLDGRFLDLETPVFIGHAVLGALTGNRDLISTDPRRGHGLGIGFNSVQVLIQWQYFIACLSSRCQALADFHRQNGDLKISDPLFFFANEITKQFSKDHLIHNAEQVEAFLFELIGPAVNSDSEIQQNLRRFLKEFSLTKFAGQNRPAENQLRLERRFKLPYSSGGDYDFFTYREFPPRTPLSLSPLAELLSKRIFELEQVTSVDTALEKIARVRAEIKSL